MRARLGTFWGTHLVRAIRATSSIIAEGYTLSFGLLVGKCHFEEVAFSDAVEDLRDGGSDVDSVIPVQHVTVWTDKLKLRFYL